MAFALHTRLDPALETTVRTLWDRLAKLDIATPSRFGFSPHVSLALVADVDLDPLADAVAALAEETAPLPVTLGSFGAFGAGNDCISFAAPVPYPALEALHRRLHVSVLPGLARGIDAHYRPGSWVPHCTLTERADAAVVARAAAEILEAGALPATGHLVSLEIVRYRPAVALRAFSLGGT